jgi:8-oxo-dGTP diphosphatase
MPPRPSLSRFPRPSVAVDLAVLTVAPLHESLPEVGQLSVMVVPAAQAPAGDDPRVLPGRFIRQRHTVKQTIAEILELELDLVPPADFWPTLLRVFDDPDRDERGWALSLAHAVTVDAARVAGCVGVPVPVDGGGDLCGQERLGYDHNEIVREAVAQIRARYEAAPDPDRLLDGPFTLSQLRHLHEAVLGEKLRKDTFNRRMRDRLEPLYDEQGEPRMRVRSVGRPAQLYRRRRRTPRTPPRSPSLLPRH